MLCLKFKHNKIVYGCRDGGCWPPSWSPGSWCNRQTKKASRTNSSACCTEEASYIGFEDYLGPVQELRVTWPGLVVARFVLCILYSVSVNDHLSDSAIWSELFETRFFEGNRRVLGTSGRPMVRFMLTRRGIRWTSICSKWKPAHERGWQARSKGPKTLKEVSNFQSRKKDPKETPDMHMIDLVLNVSLLSF